MLLELGELRSRFSPSQSGCDTAPSIRGREGGDEGMMFISVNNNRDVARVFEQPSKSRYRRHLETSPHLYWRCSRCRNTAKFVSASELVFLVKAFFFWTDKALFIAHLKAIAEENRGFTTLICKRQQILCIYGGS